MRLDREALEAQILAIEDACDAAHVLADHEGPESEVNGVMKCKGCEARLTLRRQIKYRPELTNGVLTYVLKIRDSNELPIQAVTGLNRVAALLPGQTAVVGQIKSLLGLAPPPGGGGP